MGEIIVGPYGSIFEFLSFRGSDEPITVTTKDGCMEIATSDLAAFYVEFNERLHSGPVIVEGKAEKYLKLAIQAAVEGRDTTIKYLRERVAELEREEQ